VPPVRHMYMVPLFPFNSFQFLTVSSPGVGSTRRVSSSAGTRNSPIDVEDLEFEDEPRVYLEFEDEPRVL
jgi:hypothetical protein